MSLFSWKKDKKSQNENIVETPTVSVVMTDGNIEKYPEHFMITDGENCVICDSHCYHTSLDCDNLKWEQSNSDKPLVASSIKDAKKQGKVYCQNCSRENYLFRHGRSE